MNYDRIYPCDFVNGPGCRVVLFVTGCSHKCEGCYNKSTWNPRNGSLFNANTVKELAEYLSKPYIQGITLTGGDPLYRENREDIEALVNWIKARFPNKDIWLWTGYKFEDIKHLELLQNVDVIIDGKYEQSLPTQKVWRGSDNQRLWVNHKGNWTEEI
ncbi:anaerobic ribonucleoside-triphosphate reductase activating protein [Erwinia phage Virsaitis27]|nr:anaerobic ribonucleoside-triphosphate reductase activating protein [Erwinia phage Virsaitis27]